MRKIFIFIIFLITSSVYAETGVIVSVNIQDRSIQIDQKKYVLGDGLRLVSPQNNTVSQFALKEGQKIEYWTQQASDGTQVISRIHIMSGYDDSKYPR